MIVQDAIQLEQGTDEWKQARLGYISASNFDAVMAKIKSGEAATRRDYKIRIVTERLTNQIQDSFSNSYMEWGIEQEPFARMAYEAHAGVFVEKTGFWKHPEIPYVGCSPDGLVGDDGLIEIKCPKSTTHIEYLLNKKLPKTYFWQVHGQLWVMNRQWVDFVSFDPRMPENKRLFVFRVNRDEEVINEMKEGVIAFNKECEELMKEIMA
jgi:putative phage-type endonuclease